MAEYSIDIPMAAEMLELDFPATMEKIDLDITVIPENMELEGGNARGNSAGKTGGANGRAKAIPNYLSSPTGSCHDICKYGVRPFFGEKAKRDRETSREGEHFKQTKTASEQKKKSATCIKPSPDAKTQLPDRPPAMRDVWSMVKNVVASSQQISSHGKHNSELKPKTVQTKPFLLPTPGFLSNKRNNDPKIAKDIGIQPASSLRSPRSRSNRGTESLLGSPRTGRKTGIGSPFGSPRSGRNSGIGSLLGSPRSGRKTGIGSPFGSPRSGRNSGIGSLLGSPRSGRKTGIGSPLGSPRSGRNSGIGSLLGSLRSGRKTGIRSRHGSPRSGRNSGIGSLLGSPRSGRNSGIGSSLRGTRSGKNTGIGSAKDRATSVKSEKKASSAPSAKKVASIKTRNNTNVKGVCHLKNQSNTRKTGFEHPSNENVAEKILHVIEPKDANKTAGKSSSPSFEGKSSTLAKKGTHVTHLASFPEKKNQRQAQAGVRASRSPPSISPPSMNKSLQHTQKGIHKKQSSVYSLSSISSLTSPSESIQSEDGGTISGHLATEIPSPSEVEYKRRPGSVGKISSGDEDDSPRELNSRKLGSKKGRGLYEADSRKRSFKKTESVHIDFADEFEKVVLSHPNVEDNKDFQTSFNNKIEEVALKHLDVEDKNDNQSFLNPVVEEVVLRHHDVEAKNDDQSSLNTMIEEVVLKHHDVEDKKENRILLNNMIEETASKLVQARKSKVKALVGAFESLITFQETASLATTRAH